MIRASSIVTKSIQSNSVATGVLARVIESIDEYYEKDFMITILMDYKEKRKYPEMILKWREIMKEKKIKIMHLIANMADGGAQKIVLNYIEDFRNDKDVELKLYVSESKTDSIYDKLIETNEYNVEYLNIKHTKLNIPIIRRIIDTRRANREWKRAIKEFNPDIIHVHISALLLSTLNAIASNNVPIRFDTLHSNPLRYNGKKLKIIRNAFQKENFIPICVTEEQAKIAKKYYGFKRFEIVHNGIDIRGIKQRLIEKKEARKIYDIPNDAYVIIGVGRLNKIKNFGLLIDAFRLVANNNDKALLIIAGEGEELKRLQKKVKSLNIDDKVRFIGYQNNVIPLYCAADKLVITSFSESSSLVLLEAQICGLECVISDGVPNESIITDKVKKMGKNSNIYEWSEAIQNINFKGKAICEPEEYEVHSISNRMKQIYIKYWKEYNNGKK